MVTGSLWEKDVFGKYLFAPAFFWEDVVSFGVIALHTAYLVCLLTGCAERDGLMWLALVAYAAYVTNAAQFLLKLRAARLQHGGGRVMNLPFRPAAPATAATTFRCCASAASARCSAA